ncbi:MULTISPECIES: hypothetical protein [Phenylobacterium]|uniref:Uncharacterized protein n=1 Tax=Phenylobacterium koreense TaxID=266125 RepID=A0ABV2EM94_9CAUL
MRNRSPDDPRANAPRSGASQRDPQRSFGEEGRYSSDQARYYGADNRSFSSLATHRPIGERPAWRRGRYDAGRQPDLELPYDEEDALTRGYYSLEGPHGGQEFGIEPHGHREPIVRRRPGPVRTRPEMPYGDQEIDPTDKGVRQFGPPADYAYHPDSDIEFELDYLDWREEQLRAHDREYADWRDEQRRKYDAEYVAFRSQRRDHFERSFADWRNQQGPLTAPESEGGETPPEDKV